MLNPLNVLRKYSHPTVPEILSDEGSEPSGLASDLQELIPSYLAKRRRDAIKLLKMAPENDFEPILVLAHQLQGSGTIYGFPDFTRLAAALEAAAELKDPALVNACVGNLVSSIYAARAPR